VLTPLSRGLPAGDQPGPPVRRAAPPAAWPRSPRRVACRRRCAGAAVPLTLTVIRNRRTLHAG